MRVRASLAGLKRMTRRQYAARFAIGGAITAIAGLIARGFGPEVGGLFLAFPAIFPLSATLIEKHERQRLEEKGLRGVRRGRRAAAADAAGAAVGCLALAAFAAIVWRLLPDGGPWVIVWATLAWAAFAVGAWSVWR